MRNIFRVEISRAFLNKRFILVFLLAVISFIYGYFQINVSLSASPLGAITIWQEILKRGYYGFFASFIAALPFADSLSVEKNEHMLDPILTRASYSQYLRAKSLAVTLSGFAAVLLPAVLLLLFCRIVFPADPVQIPNLSFSMDEILSGNIIQPGNSLDPSVNGYLMLCLLFLGLFGTAYALLAMGASFQTKNSLVVLGIPFICYSFGYYFIPTSRRLNWLVSTEAALLPSGNLFSPLIQFCFICLFFGANILIAGKKERQVLS
jgi:hypothetical protein